jgi:hypothetical protein
MSGAAPNELAVPTRQQVLAFIPERYSAALHLGAFTASALLAMLWLGAQARRLEPRHLLLCPLTIVAVNLIEYVAHRWVMHERRRVLPLAFDAHTMRHHMFYTSDEMAYSEPREIWLILFSAKDVAILTLAVLPLFAGLRQVTSPAVFALVTTTAIAYFVAYEWLHVIYHLPARSRVARLPILRWLRAYHAVHHRLEEMGRRHFNVAFPLWDFVFGTFRPLGS